MKNKLYFLIITLFLNLLTSLAIAKRRDLKNWNQPYRKAILDYLNDITAKSSKNYIPVKDRYAVVDLDGTVLTERPDYFHGFVSKKHLLEKLQKNTQLQKEELYQALRNQDEKYIRSHVKEWILNSFSGEKLSYLHGFTMNLFENYQTSFKGKTYSSMFLLPSVELLELLKKKSFKVYIVTTAQQEIVRPLVHKYLKIPPVQVIGSMVAFKTDKKYNFVREEKFWQPVSHGKGKVLRFRERTGKDPVFGFGNSINDTQMLKYTDSSKYRSMVLVLHHDDPREAVYTKEKMLVEAKKRDWMIIKMKEAFKRVYGKLDFVKPHHETEEGNQTASRRKRGGVQAIWWGACGLMILLVLIGGIVLVKKAKRSKESG
ncbi:MAG: haloacid dehalogenase-like hydrolase [Myxococcota bacterium]